MVKTKLEKFKNQIVMATILVHQGMKKRFLLVKGEK
jgi:hypothetical protein